MNAYILLLILLCMYIVVLIYDKDIFSPACIISESFLFCTLILCFNIKKWNINLSIWTILLIVYGNIIFILTSLFVKKVKLNSKKERKVKHECKLIKLPKLNYNFLLIFCIIISILYFISFYKIVGGFSNFSELSKAINYYRVANSYGIGDIASIPTIITQLFKILKASSLISIYVFINNLVYKKKTKERVKGQKKYLLPMMFFLPLSLLTGNRTELSTMLIAIVIIYNFASIRNGYKLNIKKFAKYLSLVVIAISLFSLTTSLTGRTSKSTGFDYFSIYFGAPIQLLDMYIKDPIEKSSILGKETFWGVNNFLSTIKGEDGYLIHLESRTVNNINLGNVYTAYRNMYQDFGIIGVTILQIIISYITTSMYLNIIYKEKKGILNIEELMYSLIVHVLCFYAFSEQFFNTVISINYLTLFLIFYFLSFFLTRFKKILRR